MFHYSKNYFAPDTFPLKAESCRDLECVEMNSELPFYAASVQLEDGEIRWLLLAGASALARVHAGLRDESTTLAVYQFKPNFRDGIALHVKRVAEWDAVVRIVTDEQSLQDVYRIAGEVLIPIEP